MAQEERQGVPASRLAGLEKFAGQVFSNSQGKYTLDDFEYFDDTPLMSTGCLTVDANNRIVAGTQIDLFSVPQGGQAGQGYPAAYGNFTYADTNLQKGQAQGKFPANQSYIAIGGGFDVYCRPVDGNGNAILQGGVPVPSANDLFQIINSVTWNWNVGGTQSPTIFYEPLKMWPSGAGVWGIGAVGTVQAAANGGPLSQPRKFPFPLMFPPQIAATLNLTVSRTITDLTLPANSLVFIAMHLRGYMLSKVR